MKPDADVKDLLTERLLHENRALRSKKQLRKKLSSAYHQYVDVDREINSLHHRMSILLGLLGPDNVAKTVELDAKARLGETLKDFASPQELRQKLRLWRAIREYLRVAGESKIGDIQTFLCGIGLTEFTRQALESALENHEDEFEITKRGHERYVALK